MISGNGNIPIFGKKIYVCANLDKCLAYNIE